MAQLRRGLEKISRLTWREAWVRSQQEIFKRTDRFFAKPDATGLKPPSRDPGKFFFDKTDLPKITELLSARMPEQCRTIIQRAERVCQHRFDLLGFVDLAYGNPIDWHLDAAHGKRSPLKPWYQVDYFSFDQVGDPKITWELNRHQHFLTLAKAYRLIGEEHYWQELQLQLSSWNQQNPVGLGINWSSALEVAFRSLSWLWVIHLLSDSEKGRQFRSECLPGLAANARHIRRFLSTYSAPNTHLLGETLALFAIAALCPEIPHSDELRNSAWEVLVREADRQVLPDGLHFEHSIYYHVYALDMLLHGRLLASRNGIPVPKALDERILRMLEILAAVAQCGAVPAIGDDDGGRLFDPLRNRSEHMLDPLATGAVLFSRSDFKAAAGRLTEEAVWLLGADAIRQWDALAAHSTPRSSQSFPASGIYILNGHDDRDLLHVCIHTGPNGQQISGHVHADALSFSLILADSPLLIDPGTFIYSEASADRNYFRGPRAHNSIYIPGWQQPVPVGAFQWRAWPNVRVESWICGKQGDLFRATRSAQGAGNSMPEHTRWLFRLPGSVLIVRDVVHGRGVTEADLTWHFAAQSRLQRGENRISIAAGKAQLALVADAGMGWSESLVDDWQSPVYGDKQQAPTARYSFRGELPTEIVSAFVVLPDQEAGQLSSITKVPTEQDAQAYRLSMPGGLWEVVFSDPGRIQTFNGYSTDAELLCFRRSVDGSVQQILAFNVTTVTIGDRKLLQSSAALPSFVFPDSEIAGES